MKITFNINYRAEWGEQIRVVVHGAPQGGVVSLEAADGERWSGAAELEPSCVEYHYELYCGAEVLRSEIVALPHMIEIKEAMGECRVEDVWRDLAQENYRYSAAFSTFVAAEALPKLDRGRYITFRVLSPALAGERLAITGSSEALGGWREAQSMREVAANVWSVSLPIVEEYIEYKFVAVSHETGRIAKWESGENRVVALSSVEGSYFAPECEVLFDSAPCRIAGSAIPIFSLRSAGSCGVGDFGDLKQYIRWAAETNQRAVQILPINDTTMNNTWQDSYPYNAISIYAFHPMYIDLRALPSLKSQVAMREFEQQREALNALSALDYEAVNTLKRGYLRELFAQEGERVLQSDEFKSFFSANSYWLLPYAAFSHLRDEMGSAKFSSWSRHSVYCEQSIARLCDLERGVSFYYYLQYILHIQLLEAANEARALGVILKGDIPIGISRDSVEAWVEPHLFNMSGQAGAPPDAFSVNGQNWGFPTYNWDVMARDGYLWWRRRFEKMAEYFTAYRIDHILGFFRIWEIPQHSVHGLLGHFAPAMAMSVEEIEGWGLHFQRDFMTTPFINDRIVDEVFGAESDMVRERFLRHLHHDIYAMREEFSTQRLIEAHFRGAADERSLCVKEGLYSLVSNVLFVEAEEGGYHPRIAAQEDRLFPQLSDGEREAFNRLYNHYYYERHNEFWYREAMKKLPMLTCATSMLVCGEDLGMVPDCVAPVMEQLQILSLEIERMPKDPREAFGNPALYPHRSVCTIGTHDMTTLRGWWEEEERVPATATGEICREVVARHMASPSMLAILTWQDWLSMDEALRNKDVESERINIPANPRNYWRWRMHLTLEELMASKELNATIRKMIHRAGRGE